MPQKSQPSRQKEFGWERMRKVKDEQIDEKEVTGWGKNFSPKGRRRERIRRRITT